MVSSDTSLYQGTVTKKIKFAGVGLHTGKLVELEISPLEPDSGIIFQRTDLPNSHSILAHPSNVVSTTLCTTIGHEDTSIATIEHLMAAFSGLGIDNALVHVNACEIPILDGSSVPFVDKLNEVGVQIQGKKRPIYIPTEPIEVSIGDQIARLEPSSESENENLPTLDIFCSIDFQSSSAIGEQSLHLKVNRRNFMDICEARTFCHIEDVNKMRSQGLARGGSLDNAIVVNDTNVLNLEGLRYQDEFVRHKMLDCIGDLALLGARLTGKLTLHKAGHHIHTLLTKKIIQNKSVRVLYPPKSETSNFNGPVNALEGMGYMGLAAMAKQDS